MSETLSWLSLLLPFFGPLMVASSWLGWRAARHGSVRGVVRGSVLLLAGMGVFAILVPPIVFRAGPPYPLWPGIPLGLLIGAPMVLLAGGSTAFAVVRQARPVVAMLAGLGGAIIGFPASVWLLFWGSCVVFAACV